MICTRPRRSRVRLLGQQVAHPLRAGFGGVVDVHAGHGLTGRIAAPVFAARHATSHRMVEDVHAVGAGQLLEKLLRLRIIAVLDLVVVVEVADGALVLGQAETFLVERHLRQHAAEADDGDFVRVVDDVAARDTRRWIVRKGARPLGRGSKVVQLRLDPWQLLVGQLCC